MAIQRIAGFGQRTQRLSVSFANMRKIAQTVKNASCVSRRAAIPQKVVGRVIYALAHRRICYTNQTGYAQQFDKVVAGLGAVVPTIVNDVVRGLPVGGQVILQGEACQVEPSMRDKTQAEFYINSDLFRDDLNMFKAFAQAHGLAFVSIDSNQPNIVPAVTMRFETALASEDIITLPYDYRSGTTTIAAGNFVTGRHVLVARQEIGQNIDAIAVGQIDGELLPLQVDPLPANADAIVQIEMDPRAVPTLTFWSVQYHSSGADDQLNSEGKAYAALFPLTLHKDRLNALPDWLDVLTGGRTFITFLDNAELDLFVETAINFIIMKIALKISKEQTATAGTVDNRSGYKQQVGYVSRPGESTPNVNPSQISDQVYRPNPPFQGGNESSGTLMSPPQRNNQQRNTGGRGRGGSSRNNQASAYSAIGKAQNYLHLKRNGYI